MRIPKIDLRPLEHRYSQRRISRALITGVVSILTVSALLFGTQAIFSDHPLAEKWTNETFLGHLRTLVRSADKPLVGENDDRINILLLGMGGEGHDGPNLTDTIIVASYKPSTDQIALLSIPRDLVVSTPHDGVIKINAINAYAEARERGSGADEVAGVVSAILHEQINYWVRVDFHGFEQAIDAVGGVTVTVDRSFTDPTFPVEENRIGTIAFAAGSQHMNGTTALNFTRSRHGNNGEGSDFARSKRQEKILVALREKILRTGTLLNPFTVEELIGTARKNIQTNFETWELLRLARQAAGVKPEAIATKTMNDQNILESTTDAIGAFVLRPKNGDWTLVTEFAKNVFTIDQKAAVNEPKEIQVPLRIEIQNGTSLNGLAARAASRLSGLGYNVVRIKNAPTKDYQTSVVYDLTEKGASSEHLTKIRTAVNGNLGVRDNQKQGKLPLANATNTNTPLPEPVDIIVILGTNTSL